MKRIKNIFVLMIVLPMFGGTLFSQNTYRPATTSPQSPQTMLERPKNGILPERQAQQPTDRGGAARQQTSGQQTAVKQNPPSPAGQPAKDSVNMRPVDLKSKRMFPVPVGDSTGYALVGDVILYHNGAVITCDSLVRYNDRKMECFGNVVINKDSTYIYGDVAQYDGDTNTAQVFSPLIKVRDGDATLYTYGFKFDTKENVGEFYGGGTLLQNQNRMEADRGYYYSDTKDVIGVDRVELKNENYSMKSDSVKYNMDAEVASFYTRSNIWNTKGEILSADRGDYFNKEDRYEFRSSSYILTTDYEIWADSIDYAATAENAELWHDIQANNRKDKMMAFGNYAKYIGETGDGVLTDDPALISYDTEQSDTVYVRADSIFIYLVDSLGLSTLTRRDSTYINSLEAAKNEVAALPDEELIVPDTIPNNLKELIPEPQTTTDHNAVADVPAVIPTTSEYSTDSVTVVNSAERGRRTEEMSGLWRRNIDENEETTVSSEDLQADEKQDDNVEIGVPEMTGLSSATESVGKESTEAQVPVRIQTSGDGQEQSADTISTEILEGALPDTTDTANTVAADMADTPDADTVESVETISSVDTSLSASPNIPDMPAALGDGLNDSQVDSVALLDVPIDSLPLPISQVDSAAVSATQADTIGQQDRIILAYGDVKIFRSDFQAVCDSLLAFTADSTVQMHIKPVLWNDVNQIVSDRVDVETKNQKPSKAIFSGGSPIMSSELDTTRYNQVAGKTITSYFDDGAMYRTDVNGNARTYYYITDDSDGAVMGFLVSECSDITFYVEDNTIESIVWRNNPTYSIYPMTDIPRDQSQILPEFAWFIDRKPSQEEVFDKTINESEREYYEALPQPLFPITYAIDQHRKILVEGGIWADREDEITDETREFINTREPYQTK